MGMIPLDIVLGHSVGECSVAIRKPVGLRFTASAFFPFAPLFLYFGCIVSTARSILLSRNPCGCQRKFRQLSISASKGTDLERASKGQFGQSDLVRQLFWRQRVIAKLIKLPPASTVRNSLTRLCLRRYINLYPAPFCRLFFTSCNTINLLPTKSRRLDYIA